MVPSHVLYMYKLTLTVARSREQVGQEEVYRSGVLCVRHNCHAMIQRIKRLSTLPLESAFLDHPTFEIQHILV